MVRNNHSEMGYTTMHIRTVVLNAQPMGVVGLLVVSSPKPRLILPHTGELFELITFAPPGVVSLLAFLMDRDLP